jgi:hypothetical protein
MVRRIGPPLLVAAAAVSRLAFDDVKSCRSRAG